MPAHSTRHDAPGPEPEREEALTGANGSSATGERDRQAKAVFAEAIEQPEGERAAFLTRACADPALRAEVESLLLAHELCERTFEKAAPEPLAEEPGQTIGHYRLVQEIGAGGFGVVWMAEQLEPVRRKVALKVLKLGMDTKQVVARFEAERQALALMDHPNIAKVFDGGATETGRPYFVMELVPGVPITRFCNEAGLSLRERLELFLRVCQAVQHAHTKGIIHRDLKPGNVLVTLHDGTPVPKVIDFGVAKATHRELTTTTVLTELRQMLGTPEYMAPEQAELSGLDVDTRADIYSLGVLLYEILTGSRPFELRDAVRAGCEELLRQIREVDPPKPSTRVSTMGRDLAEVARVRGVHPKALGKLLRRDLDWLVMKALEKDRSRRYATASAFAEDVQRYLDDEPVRAGPPGRVYRFTKYLRRHRVGATAVAAVFLSLVAGLAAALVSYADARRNETLAIAAGREAEKQKAAAIDAQQKEERLRVLAEASAEEAKKQAKLAGSVVDLMQRCLSSADPHEHGANYTVRQLFEAMERERTDLKDAPEVEATQRRTMGLAYLGIGLSRRAEPHLDRALKMRQTLFGEESTTVAESRLDWARLLHDLGDYKGAEATAKQALAVLERFPSGNEVRIAQALDALSDYQRHLARYPDAWASVQRALEIRRSLCGEENPETSVHSLLLLLQERGDLAAADKLARDTLKLRQEIHGDEHLSVATGLACLASVLASRGDPRGAEGYASQALAMRRKLLGSEPHPLVADSLNHVGNLLNDKEDLPGAEKHHREALVMRQATLGNGHPDIAVSLNNLAAVLRKKGDLPSAEEHYRRALAIVVTFHGEEHPDVAKVLDNLATTLVAKSEFGEAERLRNKALAMNVKLLGEVHPAVAGNHYNIGQLLGKKEDLDGAERHLQRALTVYRQLHPQGHPDMAWTLRTLGNVRLEKEDPAGAERFLEHALKMLRRLQGEASPQIAKTLTSLGEVQRFKRDLDGAERFHREAWAMQQRIFGSDDHSVDTINCLGLVLHEKRDLPEAERLSRLALEIDRKLYGERKHVDRAALLHNLGVVLEARKNLADAEKYLREALQMRRECLGRHRRVAVVLHNLGHLLGAKGEHAEAEQLLREALEMNKELLGPEHPTVATTLYNLGYVLMKKGDFTDAQQRLEESLSMRRKWPGEQEGVANCLHLLGHTLKERGNLEGAVEALREELGMRTKLLGDDHYTTAITIKDLASMLQDKRDLIGAEKILRESAAMTRQVVGDEHADVVHALACLVDGRNEPRSAMDLFQRCLDLRRASLGSPHAKVAKDLQSLAAAQEKAGEIALASASHKEAVEMLRGLAPGDTGLADGLAAFGLFLLGQKQNAEAEPILRECHDIRIAKIPNDSLRYNAMSMLGGALLGQGRYAEAERLLVEGYEKMAPSFSALRRRQALERIVSLYELWGRPEEAKAWKAKLEPAGEGKGQ